MGRPLISLTEKFWKYVRKTDGCWLWTAAPCGSHGYGHMRSGDGPYVMAHRYSWEIHVGPIPFGLQVLHRCDVPLCVNPSHLFLGTQADNIADKVAKGRQARGETSGRYTKPERTARGERHGMARLTEEKVKEIRARRANGEKQNALAAEFGVGTSTISRVVRGAHWACA